MTNADMIRAMNDEKLAEAFCGADWCNYCGQLKQDGTCHAMEIYSRTIEVRQLENRRSIPIYGRNIQKQGGKIQ